MQLVEQNLIHLKYPKYAKCKLSKIRGSYLFYKATNLAKSDVKTDTNKIFLYSRLSIFPCQNSKLTRWYAISTVHTKQNSQVNQAQCKRTSLDLGIKKSGSRLSSSITSCHLPAQHYFLFCPIKVRLVFFFNCKCAICKI